MMLKICPECDGTGGFSTDTGWMICSDCDGTGEIEIEVEHESDEDEESLRCLT